MIYVVLFYFVPLVLGAWLGIREMRSQPYVTLEEVVIVTVATLLPVLNIVWVAFCIKETVNWNKVVFRNDKESK